MQFGSMRPLHLDEESGTVGRMVAAFHNNDFRFGSSVMRKGTDAVPADKLIKGFKLLLYETYKRSALVKKIEAQLREAEVSLVRLLELVLGRIWAMICSSAERRGVKTDRAVIYLPIHLVATETATETMALAAKRAGLPRVRFAYEPLCAGISIVTTLLGEIPTEDDYIPYVRLYNIVHGALLTLCLARL